MRNLFLSLAALSILTFQSLAHAGLGEKATSLDRDKKSLNLVEKSQKNNTLYTVHELSQSSLTIKEYADQQGVVFAVTWKGNTHPDLSSLLGVYLGEYQEALKTQKLQRGHKRVSTLTTQNVIVEKSGSMRAARGRAYVPTLVPSGVSVNDIQ